MSHSDVDLNPVEVLAEKFLDRHRRGECTAIAEYTGTSRWLADRIGAFFPIPRFVEKFKPVQALVRRDDERGDASRATDVEVVVGDLTRAGAARRPDK